MFLCAFLFVPLTRVAFHWIQHNTTQYNTIQHAISVQPSMSTQSTILHANAQYNTQYQYSIPCRHRVQFFMPTDNTTLTINTAFHVNTEYNTSCQRTIQHSVSIQHSMSTQSTILHANGQCNTRYAAYRISIQYNVDETCSCRLLIMLDDGPRCKVSGDNSFSAY